MDDNSINIFRDAPDNVTMPTINGVTIEVDEDMSPEELENKLMGTDSDNIESSSSQDVSKAISSDVVPSRIIQETNRIYLPNYMLKFTSMENLSKFAVIALNTFIKEDGETPLYLMVNGELIELGRGYKDNMDKLLFTGVKSLFGDMCTVYKDIEAGKQPKKASDIDTDSIRLHI